VHVYFSILWENRYKKFYALICNEFIAQVHFIIFRKEFPRISVEAKKMISKVGHWYFEETNTYIRLFRAIGTPHLLPHSCTRPSHFGRNLLPDHYARM
jgi:hypothetical protein